VTGRTLAFEHVWKGYPDWSAGPPTLRGMFARRAPGIGAGRRLDRWALHDVSVAVSAGQSLGLLGHNGAGKSTFLRLASGLGRPSRGTIETHPDAASVLNLGSAFDDQLTGRENAYTAALVSGLDRGRARGLVPEVLDFAELAGFEEAPVRTYSEGMKLRLAFSAIAVLEPRLLVLDEVLAVGDLAFRTKCMARIAELQRGGTTLVLASHSLDELAETCQQTLWLHHGEVRAYGDTETIVEEYERAVHERTLGATPVGASSAQDGLAFGENRFGSQELMLTSVQVAGTLATDPPTVRSGDPLKVVVDLEARDGAVADPIVVLSIHRRADEETMIDLSTAAAGISLGRDLRRGRVELEIERLDLAAGDYAVNVGAFHADWEHAYDYHWGVYDLRVEGASGGRGRMVPPVRWNADTG
jgi:lipopolysaccharide transport system ATP-binding protein